VNLLGLDLGTGSAKALLLAPEGRVLGEASATYPVRAPHPGWAESDPSDWWDALAACVREAVGGHEVAAIGLSGQMHGVVLCDESGRAIRPAVLWADTRSAGELEPFRALPEAARQRLANPPAAGMAGPTLLWLRDNEADTYDLARWALQPKDWLRLRLTGAVGAEPSDASGTLLYDLPGDGWATDIVAGLGLAPSLLPPLGLSTATAGGLTASAATHLGLQAGTPVAYGAADTAAALLGSGLLDPGEVQVTVGSGAQIVALTDGPTPDPRIRTHLYRAVIPDRWYAMAAMQNAGVALEWVRANLGLDWPELYALVATVPAGSEGLTFQPYLTGERTPYLDANARGAWAGLGLHHSRAHMARAALEGVAFSLRDGLKALEENGIRAPVLRLAGGGTTNPLWRQMIADVLERPLVATSVPAASARGAAILAGVASGAYATVRDAPPLPAPEPAAEPGYERGAYRESYARYRDLYPRLKGWGQSANLQLPQRSSPSSLLGEGGEGGSSE
jgi:xylulokinase